MLELEPIDYGPCGDGQLLADEECDDGSNESGDGCGATCKIELGFECPTANEPCLPVLGLSRGPVTTTLEAAGSNTGNEFSFSCPLGEVVIGFEGYANGVGDNLGRIRAVCGSLALTAEGHGLLTRTSESEYFGGSQSGPLLTAICGQDEVATGFVPTINTFVSGFQWVCQQVSHTSGALQFGATRSLPFGPLVGQQEAARSCTYREAISTVFGRGGISVDALGFGCSEVSSVLCGDGITTAPETCDDGNLTRGDGCDRRCQRE